MWHAIQQSPHAVSNYIQKFLKTNTSKPTSLSSGVTFWRVSLYYYYITATAGKQLKIFTVYSVSPCISSKSHADYRIYNRPVFSVDRFHWYLPLHLRFYLQCDISRNWKKNQLQQQWQIIFNKKYTDRSCVEIEINNCVNLCLWYCVSCRNS